MRWVPHVLFDELKVEYLRNSCKFEKEGKDLKKMKMGNELKNIMTSRIKEFHRITP